MKSPKQKAIMPESWMSMNIHLIAYMALILSIVSCEKKSRDDSNVRASGKGEPTISHNDQQAFPRTRRASDALMDSWSLMEQFHLIYNGVYNDAEEIAAVGSEDDFEKIDRIISVLSEGRDLLRRELDPILMRGSNLDSVRGRTYRPPSGIQGDSRLIDRIASSDSKPGPGMRVFASTYRDCVQVEFLIDMKDSNSDRFSYIQQMGDSLIVRINQRINYFEGTKRWLDKIRH